jgi:serine/threonine protein kinase
MGEGLSRPQPLALSHKPGTPRTRALPLDEALAIARQIADALEAAHEAGVIHRDLKPANIKVRPDGTVKVLDFGLAKLTASEASGASRAGGVDLSQVLTLTTPAATRMGVIMGTAAYMSPEQAKGKPVDKRCDIWACGCVLYEMLTGKRAFDGEDVTDTIVSVLSKEPNLNALPATTPPAIRRLLRRSLAKDRRASDCRMRRRSDWRSRRRWWHRRRTAPSLRHCQLNGYRCGGGRWCRRSRYSLALSSQASSSGKPPARPHAA